MNEKEITPLEALERLVDGNLNEVNYYRQFCDSTTYIMKDKETIETALKRLETLEEEKQGFDRQLEKKLKEKQEQDKILTRYGLSSKDLEEACKHLKAIKNGDFGLFFEDYEKQKKALEIIKMYFWLEDFQDFVAFNGRLPKSFKEEYALLKEVFLCQ